MDLSYGTAAANVAGAMWPRLGWSSTAPANANTQKRERQPSRHNVYLWSLTDIFNSRARAA